MRREEKNAVGRHTSCQVAIHRFVRVWFEECARPLLTTSRADMGEAARSKDGSLIYYSQSWFRDRSSA